MTDKIKDLLEDVYVERLAQIEEFGVQRWRSIYSERVLRDYERKADSLKQINDARDEAGDLSWDGILLEEVYEALSETEPSLRIDELIQVAAVALAEAEAIQALLDELDQSDDESDEEEVA